MIPIEKRLRELEQTSINKAPLLIYISDGRPTSADQADIDQAKRDGRPVFLVNKSDADL